MVCSTLYGSNSRVISTHFLCSSPKHSGSNCHSCSSSPPLCACHGTQGSRALGPVSWHFRNGLCGTPVVELMSQHRAYLPAVLLRPSGNTDKVGLPLSGPLYVVPCCGMVCPQERCKPSPALFVSYLYLDSGTAVFHFSLP